MNEDRPSAKGEPKDLNRKPDRDTSGTPAGKGSTASTAATGDDAWWRDNYSTRPYIDSTYGYDDYGPAYVYGYEAYQIHRGRSFDDVESELGSGWDKAKGNSRLTWEHAKAAVRDAWDRLVHRGERKPGGEDDRYLG